AGRRRRAWYARSLTVRADGFGSGVGLRGRRNRIGLRLGRIGLRFRRCVRRITSRRVGLGRVDYGPGPLRPRLRLRRGGHWGRASHGVGGIRKRDWRGQGFGLADVRWRDGGTRWVTEFHRLLERR